MAQSIRANGFGFESHLLAFMTNSNLGFVWSKWEIWNSDRWQNKQFLHFSSIHSLSHNCFLQSCSACAKWTRKGTRWADICSVHPGHRRTGGCLYPAHEDVHCHFPPNFPTGFEQCVGNIAGRIQKNPEHPHNGRARLWWRLGCRRFLEAVLALDIPDVTASSIPLPVLIRNPRYSRLLTTSHWSPQKVNADTSSCQPEMHPHHTKLIGLIWVENFIPGKSLFPLSARHKRDCRTSSVTVKKRWWYKTFLLFS